MPQARSALTTAALVIASLIALVAWVSGIVWYPMIELVYLNAIACIILTAVGIWFGASRRLDSRLVLGLGSGAIIVGLLCYLGLLGMTRVTLIESALYLGGAILFLIGYALLVGRLIRAGITMLQRRRGITESR